jgi:photosystem II stability/assembly factor-like uncharacterized protein
MRPIVLRTLAACTAALVWSGVHARPEPRPAATDAERWAAVKAHESLREASPFHGLTWRSIGPVSQGGRVVDVENIPGQPYGFYVAYATGGVWKTTNNGVSFEPLSDRLPTMVVGDIAVDPHNPDRLWVGSGEPNSARSNYGGLGLFRSDDGGKTFRHVGLEDTDRIGHVWVDPTDGEHVCVAALGKLYTTGGRRGVFCSWDGGTTWSQTLKGANAWTGAIDLTSPAGRGDVLYAATWERSRTPWNFVEGGVGSGVWKSEDGGRTWLRLPGFPSGAHVGRIGLTVSASHPDTLYASIDNQEPLPAAEWDLGDRPLSPLRLRNMSKEEFLRQDPEEIETFIRENDLDTALDAKALVAMVREDRITVAQLVERLTDGNASLFNTDIRGLEVWRSDDAGASWRRTHDTPIREVTYTYGYYFGTIRVAPDNPERVFIVGVPMVRSDDGGKTWVGNQDPDVHVDYHAQWIDPSNPQRMIVGNDGGADISYDGGKTWLKLDAQPVGQFYTIMVDNAEPYNVYGGLQDNGTMMGPSTTRWELGQDWRVIGGGDGMHVAVDPRDNKTVYTGYQFGWYRRSDGQEVRPRPSITDAPLRYNWNTPVRLSVHNPDIVYYGANRLFRSMDRGETWTAISPDLTTSKERGDVPFATITSFSESPKAFGMIWAGTDDGNVWFTDDGGVEWRRVDGRLPEGRWVSRVEASKADVRRAYVALNGYRNDDIAPYVYATEDAGASWRDIGRGLPAAPVNVVREDPENADVLYVGTDRGVYVSLDRGRNWDSLQQNLPNVPVHDLIVHPRDRELVAGTHGRSAWIVDVLPVQELAAVRDEAVHVFALNPVQADRDWRSRLPRWFDATPYLPEVVGSFWAGSDGTAKVRILDADDRVVQRFEVVARKGVNRLAWNVQVDRELALAAEAAANEKRAKDAKEPLADEGALSRTPYAESARLGHVLYALPGKYKVEVALGEASAKATLEIKAPEARKPRTKPAPKVRGKDDWAGAASTNQPHPRARSTRKPRG